MGINYYFRRDDNRTRFFLGKNYALARMIGGVTLWVSGPEIGNLASQFALAFSAEYSRSRIPDWGRDASGRPSYFVALATEIAQWSAGQPIRLVSESRFDDWHDDAAWDGEASTTSFSQDRSRHG